MKERQYYRCTKCGEEFIDHKKEYVVYPPECCGWKMEIRFREFPEPETKQKGKK